MCSWSSRDDTPQRVLAALVGEGNEAAARVLADDTSPEFAADLIAALNEDIARVPVRGEPSPAELEVLRLAGEGWTCADTAAIVGRSIETVKTHRKHVIDKLDAKNIAHAFAIAYRRGLLA